MNNLRLSGVFPDTFWSNWCWDSVEIRLVVPGYDVKSVMHTRNEWLCSVLMRKAGILIPERIAYGLFNGVRTY